MPQARKTKPPNQTQNKKHHNHGQDAPSVQKCCHREKQVKQRNTLLRHNAVLTLSSSLLFCSFGSMHLSSFTLPYDASTERPVKVTSAVKQIEFFPSHSPIDIVTKVLHPATCHTRIVLANDSTYSRLVMIVQMG